MQPKTYRKVAHDVEAIQWNKENQEPTLRWLSEKGCTYTYNEIASADELIIYTNQGPAQVNNGWWIVCGFSNEFYVLNPEVFNKLHREVEPDDSDGV